MEQVCKVKPLLLVDMSGVLGHRSETPIPGAHELLYVRHKFFYDRVGVVEFLRSLSRHFEIAVYTSITLRNVTPVLNAIDSAWSSYVSHVFDQSFNKPDPNAQNPWDTVRDMEKIWAFFEGSGKAKHSERDTVLLDNEARKFQDVPRNGIVVPEFGEREARERRGGTLTAVQKYLEEMAGHPQFGRVRVRSGPAVQLETCPVCFEPFSAELHDPLLLPCGHTVCRPCLTAIEDHRAAAVAVECPVCRKSAGAPVSQLPKNFALVGLVSSIKCAGVAVADAAAAVPPSAAGDEFDVREYMEEHPFATAGVPRSELATVMEKLGRMTLASSELDFSRMGSATMHFHGIRALTVTYFGVVPALGSRGGTVDVRAEGPLCPTAILNAKMQLALLLKENNGTLKVYFLAGVK